MRRALWITVVMLIGVGAPAPMHASKALMEGMTPCGFGIEFTQPAAVDGTLHLRVGIGGYYDSTAVGEVRIVIPRDVQLVAGDTLIRTLVVGDPRRAFPLVIRPRWPGIYIISAVAAVSVPGIRVDESEVEISAEVRSDTTVLGTCRVVRQETVRGGQRYRYAGPFLVPISAPERITEDDIFAGKHRASASAETGARCLNCTSSLSGDMTWVVFVAPDGRIKDARPIDGSRLELAAVQAAREALGKWTFTPAEVGGKAVSDWIVVHVPFTK